MSERRLAASMAPSAMSRGHRSVTSIAVYGRSGLAGLYRSARAALVTPLRDGMNLVAKEYVAAQDEENPGVLVLSRFAGAAPECVGALLVNPYDPESVAGAIANALEMPLAERKERHAASLSRLRQNGGNVWSENFLRSLRVVQAADALPIEEDASAEWKRSQREARTVSQR